MRLSPTRLHSSPTLDANHKSRVLPVILTEWLEDWRFSWTPSWMWLICRVAHRTQRNILLSRSLDYKGYTSGAARGKRCVGQSISGGRRASTPSLSTPLSLDLPGFIHLDVLWTLSGFLLEVSLHRHGWLYLLAMVTDPNSSLTPPPLTSGNLTPKVPVLSSSGHQPPPLGTFQNLLH